MSARSLEGRRALVTGAGGGIGSATARALAAAGAEVTLVGRSIGPLMRVADEITAAGGRATPCPLDVTDRAAVAAVLDPLPSHDIVVNAAGTNRPQPFIEVDADTFDTLFAVNVLGLFAVTQHQVRRLIAEGRAGVVVNVSSQMGHVGAPDRTVYCGTKHAVEGITKALGVELAPHGIRVVSVAPTWIETDLTRPFFADRSFLDRVLADLPLGRVGQPEEVARAIVFLASDDGSLITGSSLLLDGGWTAH
jgi:NAD(P)-dependent dehydrogenase (short-subunit alcohol dehydrogenase family)